MRRTLTTLGIGVLLGLIFVGVCGGSGYSVAQGILSNKLEILNLKFKIARWCFNGLPFVDQLDTLLDNKTYLVILQNNQELRPSGGFMGSYAKIHLRPTGLDEFIVQDIYVPDGQIVGHVDPPAPIQQAFGQGWWKLRDSNWDPDFTVAAPQIAWFFDQGGEKVDGLVAVNLSLVNSLLSSLGEIKATDYSETVSAKTFYNLAQKYAEVDFFPGSTQKRDFLGAVGNALMGRIINSTPYEKLKLVKLLWRQLKQGEIMLWFKDNSLQETVKQRNWDGELGHPVGDYLYIVETNLGANKANCCVSREVTRTVDSLRTSLRINYRNDNPFENPKPPYFWGGNYIDYLRIVLPKSTQIQSVRVEDKQLVEKQLDNVYGIQDDRYQVEERGKSKLVGFWAVVPAQQSVTVELNYQLSIVNSPFRVLAKHQPGMDPIPYKLIVNGKLVLNSMIDRDHEFNVER